MTCKSALQRRESRASCAGSASMPPRRIRHGSPSKQAEKEKLKASVTAFSGKKIVFGD